MHSKTFIINVHHLFGTDFDRKRASRANVSLRVSVGRKEAGAELESGPERRQALPDAKAALTQKQSRLSSLG